MLFYILKVKGIHNLCSQVSRPMVIKQSVISFTYLQNYGLFSTETVVYMINRVALTGGYVDQQRDTLHRKKVPNTHVCVLLTTAHQNVTFNCRRH